MATLTLRWSEHEARKPYARPFAVTFVDDDGLTVGAIAVSGTDLLYYRQFQVAVLTLAGELYRDRGLEAGADPQRAWLDRLTGLLPPLGELSLRPVSTFDHERGRMFHIAVDVDGAPTAVALEPGLIAEYQEFQASLAHQTGRLYRNPDVENVPDTGARQATWVDCVSAMLERPPEGEAIAERWPWHSGSQSR